MDTDDWLWTGAAGFAAGFVLLFVQGRRRRTREEESHWILHLCIVLTAFTAYLAMALGGGRSIVDGRELFWARYIDWAITTPLLLLGLGLTALDTPMRRLSLLLGVLFTDMFMIATGAFADLSPRGSDAKWLWYAISTGAFVAIYAALWGTMRREAAVTGPRAAQLYGRTTLFLSTVWLVYPINFLLGPEGLRWFDTVTSTAIYAVTDLVAKVVFGVYALAGTRAKSTRDLAEGLVPEHDRRPAGRALHEAWTVKPPA